MTDGVSVRLAITTTGAEGEVRDGKIQAVREYMDTAYAARKLSGGRRAAA